MLEEIEQYGKLIECKDWISNRLSEIDGFKSTVGYASTEFQVLLKSTISKLNVGGELKVRKMSAILVTKELVWKSLIFVRSVASGVLKLQKDISTTPENLLHDSILQYRKLAMSLVERTATQSFDTKNSIVDLHQTISGGSSQDGVDWHLENKFNELEDRDFTEVISEQVQSLMSKQNTEGISSSMTFCKDQITNVCSQVGGYHRKPVDDTFVSDMYEATKKLSCDLLGESLGTEIALDAVREIFVKGNLCPNNIVYQDWFDALDSGLLGENIETSVDFEQLDGLVSDFANSLSDSANQVFTNIYDLGIEVISNESNLLESVEESISNESEKVANLMLRYGTTTSNSLTKEYVELIQGYLNVGYDQGKNILSRLLNASSSTDDVGLSGNPEETLVKKLMNLLETRVTDIQSFSKLSETAPISALSNVIDQVYGIVTDQYTPISNLESNVGIAMNFTRILFEDDEDDEGYYVVRGVSQRDGDTITTRDASADVKKLEQDVAKIEAALQKANFESRFNGNTQFANALKTKLRAAKQKLAEAKEKQGEDASEVETEQDPEQTKPNQYSEDEWEEEDEEEEEEEEEEDEDDGGDEDGEDGDDYDDYEDEYEDEYPEDDQDVEDGEEEDEDPTTPMNSDPSDDNSQPGMKSDKTKNIGWKGTDPEVKTGIAFMMHDGDQQLFNPYGEVKGKWTIYSFRPSDANNQYPQIAITPSSFEALDSMDTMLDNIPYVVVREYFFKNAVSQMANFVENLKKTAEEVIKGVTAEDKPVDTTPDQSSQGSSDTKSTGNGILDKIASKFEKVEPKMAVIDIPYVLYCCLRKKVYGNTYVFPYIVNSSTIINQANNSSEWGGNGSGSFLDSLKGMMQNVANFIGGTAAALTGSNAMPATLFPTPTWGGPGQNQDKIQFQFDLMLINDNAVKARNNYMCVNTIINNNRYIQKAILAFPGALYELWLPTGQRHLMCTCDLKLSPLGLNRKAPKEFFSGRGGPNGAHFEIGTKIEKIGNKIYQDHEGSRGEKEVIPDGYKLSLTFQSCLANNLNTSVFQYYVKMVEYTDEAAAPGKEDADTGAIDLISNAIWGNTSTNPATTPDTNTATKGGDYENLLVSTPRDFSKAIVDVVDSPTQEKFDESTYNNRIGKLKSSLGDIAINADSAILAIRNAQSIISESTKFLNRLYNAQGNNLWYRPYEKEEYYTTLEPNYQQILRKRYQDNLTQLRSIEKELSTVERTVSGIQDEMAESQTLQQRNNLLEEKVTVTKKLQLLRSRKMETVDELLQVDTDLIQSALDYHDNAVSVGKNELTSKIFKQVWNEKIMNSYEKDRIQYMTSQEKTEYFAQKVRDLAKWDVHGILTHSDWFYRVVVLDYIVSEMQRLVLIFKSCTCDDFETIYRIVRKLNLLKLDVEQVYSSSTFDINKMNLFQLSSSDIKKFTKIDELLRGNTLYELFKNQLSVVSKATQIEDSESEETPVEDKELIQEQKSELDIRKRRAYRQEIVTRYWGSESNLTKEAYSKVNDSSGTDDIVVNGQTFKGGIVGLKNRIITLKLNNKPEEQEELKNLLSAFTNLVSTIKEGLVLDKMREVNQTSSKMIESEDGNVNALTTKPLSQEYIDSIKNRI